MTSTEAGQVARKHPLANCEQCPLQAEGKYVSSSGPDHAQVAIVGEAPGVQEARVGTPFIGPSGKLLDAVMTHQGIRRSEVLLANAASCRPADGSTPPKSAIIACRPRLIAELEQHGVETAVALGNSAAEALLGMNGVTKLRVGPGKESKFIEGLRVIPTVHPAACLRQGDMFPSLVTDIGKVVKPQVKWVEPQYVVADTEREALDLLHQVEQRTYDPELPLVIDIEVDVEKDTAFDHPNHYGMLCVGIGYERNKALVLGENACKSKKVLDFLRQLLLHRKIIAQNGKFDLAGLYPLLGPLTLWFDTMLASYCFDERPGIHGLKFMAVEYLGAPQYDDEIKQYVGKGQGYGAIPRDKLYKYNATDITSTYEMYLMWLGRFNASDEGLVLRRVHDHLVAASNQLMYVELNGISIDRDYLTTLATEMTETLDATENKIDTIVQKDYDKRGGINPRSPMQVKAYFKDHHIDVASTNKDTVQLLIDKYSQKLTPDVLEFCKTLLEHRRQAKLYGTYVEGIRKRMYRGRVYPSFLLHGTTTGRLSCRNPNLQNIPRESSIRALFIPSREDHIFVQTDYSQAELRVLSFLAGDHYFRDIFNGGERDLFDELTPVLYPSATKEALGAAAWKELRMRVKAYVYGLSYGREAFSIAREYDIPEKEARAGMNSFFDVIPEIVEFRERTRKSVLAGNDLVTPFGRRRRYALITKENVKDIMNEALAFLPQSTASDMCLQAMTRVRQELKGVGWVRNIVHDSILAECHKDDAAEVQKIMERVMIESGKQVVEGYVKIAVDTKIGENWSKV